MYDEIPPLGLVIEPRTGDPATDRLAFALYRGESLIACAAWALSEAGAQLFDDALPWEWVSDQEVPLALHDIACPATPPAFIAEAIALAEESDGAVVAFRPVTDTVKTIEGDRIGGTLDRDALRQLASPIVLSAAVVAQVLERPRDLLMLLGQLEDLGVPVHWLEAPASARRIASADALALLP